MTRHGTLAYYLTALVVGDFFMNLAIFVADAAARSLTAREFLGYTASYFLFSYFFGMVYGASTVVLYGFILRRLMMWSGATRVWQWLLAGSVLVVPLFFLLHWLRQILRFEDPGGNLLAILVGAVVADLADYKMLLPAILAGGLTAATLSYVQRAFAQGPEAQS